MQKLLALLIVAASFTACKKDDPKPAAPPPAPVDTRNVSKLTVTGKHLVGIDIQLKGSNVTLPVKFNFDTRGVLTSVQLRSGTMLTDFKTDDSSGVIKFATLTHDNKQVETMEFLYSGGKLARMRVIGATEVNETSYGYDKLDRLVGTEFNQGNGDFAYWTYIYNGQDNDPVSLRKLSPPHYADTTAYTYTTKKDPLTTLPYFLHFFDWGYPTRGNAVATANGKTINYTYDADGDILTLDNGAEVWKYTYKK